MRMSPEVTGQKRERSAYPERYDTGEIKGEDIQCENDSENGVPVPRGTIRERLRGRIFSVRMIARTECLSREVRYGRD